MRVRLLSKRDIDEAKQKDRAREAAEGLKLTRRVDGLRELTLETEANYEKYRTETLQEIQRQLESKQKEMESLDQGINTKRGELLSLSGSIDKAWLYYVNSEKALIESTKVEWQKNNDEVVRKSVELSLAKEETEAKKAEYLEQKRVTDLQFMQGTRLKRQAEEMREEAKLKATALIEKAERKERSATKKEMDAIVREQNVLLHEATLKRKEDELEDREMKVLAKELIYYSPVKKN